MLFRSVNRAIQAKTPATSAASLLTASELLLQISNTAPYKSAVYQYFLNDLSKRGDLNLRERMQLINLYFKCDAVKEAEAACQTLLMANMSPDAKAELCFKFAEIEKELGKIQEAREAIALAFRNDPRHASELVGQEPGKSLYQRLYPARAR